jgi:hypothetical protein
MGVEQRFALPGQGKRFGDRRAGPGITEEIGLQWVDHDWQIADCFIDPR